jgi:NAD+ synthase
VPELHRFLDIDLDAEVDRIVEAMRRSVRSTMRRKGAVLGLSGGIDSSVCAALAVRAFGRDKVMGLHMPEVDSADETLELSRLMADSLGIDTELEDITPILEGAGCYRRRDEAIRSVIPGYGRGWRSKIVLPSVVDSDSFRVFSVVAQPPEGDPIKARLPLHAYLEVVAATSFKQRTRKMLEYYWADRLNYAVIGTPNHLEYDQGFFVKNGDGAADFKPIAHLYKTQVYALAATLGVPGEIRSRPPTTDTYSMPQTQEEFYFSLPYDRMDLCLFGVDHGLSPADVALEVGLTEEQAARVYADIAAKRKAARYLHLHPQLLAPAPASEPA